MTTRRPITCTVRTLVVALLGAATGTIGCGGDAQEPTVDASPAPAVAGTSTVPPNVSGTSNSGLLVIPSENAAATQEIPGADNKSPAPTTMAAKIPGIVSPKMYVIDEIDLPEDTAVIGILVAGTARAYVLEALKSDGSHVVNELSGDTGLAVTYCPKADCVRVFSKSPATTPLQLAANGFRDDQLLVTHEEITYEQTAGTIPLDDVDFVRTEWLAWKIEHPETVVYLGPLAEKYVPKQRTQD